MSCSSIEHDIEKWFIPYSIAGNSNFLFTTHFARLKEILKVEPQIQWAKFQSSVVKEQTSNRLILTFTHLVSFRDKYELDPDERPDYG